MKKSIKKIHEVSGALLGIEMELSLLDQDINFVKENLVLLNKIRETLEYNIDFLRQSHIIVNMNSYSQSISDLKRINKKIKENTHSQIKLDDKKKQKLQAYDYYMNLYTQQIEMIENNILPFFKDSNE